MKARYQQSRALLERARRVLVGGVSSPFRAKTPVPLYLEDGQGARAATGRSLILRFEGYYHDQIGDIITEPFVYEQTCFTVPDGPDLGGGLDPDQVDKHHRVSLEQGEVNELYDPRRPNWVPALPIF